MKLYKLLRYLHKDSNVQIYKRNKSKNVDTFSIYFSGNLDDIGFSKLIDCKLDFLEFDNDTYKIYVED